MTYDDDWEGKYMTVAQLKKALEFFSDDQLVYISQVGNICVMDEKRNLLGAINLGSEEIECYDGEAEEVSLKEEK